MKPKVNFRDRQVLIVGSGRSGSNRMLDILDLHPQTHCRNEANVVQSGVLAKLGSGLTPDDVSKDFPNDWKIATNKIRLKLSYRDRIANQPKAFLKEWARISFGAQLFRRNKLRNFVGLLYPSISGEEWLLPSWYLNNIEDNYPLHVYKILGQPYWLKALLASELDLKIIHNLRNPHHYMASWYNRYLKGYNHKPEAVRQLNTEILTKVKRQDDYWAKRIPNPRKMNLFESELMLWVYSNETILNSGKGNNNYTYVTYEEIDNSAVETAERICEFLGLELDSEFSGKVHNMKNTLFKKTKRLKHGELAEIDLAIRKFLPNSPLAKLW